MTAILRETNSASDKKRLMEVREGERLEASGRHAACSTQRVKSLSFPQPRHPDTPETFFPSNPLFTLPFSPSGSSLKYTAKEANVPENEDEEFLCEISFSARLRRVLHWAKSTDDRRRATQSTRGLRATSPQPCRPYPYLVMRRPTLPTYLLAKHSSSYEDGEDGRRFGFGSCFNGLTAIWELKSDPVELQLQHPAGWEPSVPVHPAAVLMAVAASDEDTDPSRASRSPRPILGLKAALWFFHGLCGPHASYFSLHRFGFQAQEMTISSSLSTGYGRTSWRDSQVCVENLLALRSSGLAVGRICSRGPVRALGLRLLSSTWRNRKA